MANKNNAELYNDKKKQANAVNPYDAGTTQADVRLNAQQNAVNNASPYYTAPYVSTIGTTAINADPYSAEATRLKPSTVVSPAANADPYSAGGASTPIYYPAAGDPYNSTGLAPSTISGAKAVEANKRAAVLSGVDTNASPYYTGASSPLNYGLQAPITQRLNADLINPYDAGGSSTPFTGLSAVRDTGTVNPYDAGGASTPPSSYPSNGGGNGGGSGGNGGSGSGGGTGGNGSNPSGGNPTAPKEWAGPTVDAYYDPANDAAYQSALAALQTAQGNAPTYPGTYDAQLVDMYNTIVNRDPFKYDLNADMLYQQYAQQYVNKGRLAMMDTMGQAAGLTGGYGSSYGQMVGQQAYNSYLQELNNMIPEFYDRAYQQYADEGDWLLNQYKLLGDLSDTEYARYSDDYNRWLNERDYAQGLADQAYTRGYNEWEDRYNRGLDDAAFRAKVGDFSGYADYYGGEIADRLQTNWLYSNPDMAYRNGLMDANQYYAITGEWPAGYTPPNSGYYYGGGGSAEEEEPTGNSSYQELLGDIASLKGSVEKSDSASKSEAYRLSTAIINQQLAEGKITEQQAAALKRSSIPGPR